MTDIVIQLTNQCGSVMIYTSAYLSDDRNFTFSDSLNMLIMNILGMHFCKPNIFDS